MLVPPGASAENAKVPVLGLRSSAHGCTLAGEGGSSPVGAAWHAAVSSVSAVGGSTARSLKSLGCAMCRVRRWYRGRLQDEGGDQRRLIGSLTPPVSGTLGAHRPTEDTPPQ